MSKAATPELKKYMDKRVFIQLNGNRKVTGVLRGGLEKQTQSAQLAFSGSSPPRIAPACSGFDPFLNLVVDESVEEISDKERKEIGMVVRVREGTPRRLVGRGCRVDTVPSHVASRSSEETA